MKRAAMPVAKLLPRDVVDALTRAAGSIGSPNDRNKQIDDAIQIARRNHPELFKDAPNEDQS